MNRKNLERILYYSIILFNLLSCAERDRLPLFKDNDLQDSLWCYLHSLEDNRYVKHYNDYYQVGVSLLPNKNKDTIVFFYQYTALMNTPQDEWKDDYGGIFYDIEEETVSVTVHTRRLSDISQYIYLDNLDPSIWCEINRSFLSKEIECSQPCIFNKHAYYLNPSKRKNKPLTDDSIPSLWE